MSNYRERAVEWLRRCDTGTSSLTIWRTLMNETPERADIPYDPDDFGRPAAANDRGDA